MHHYRLALFTALLFFICVVPSIAQPPGLIITAPTTTGTYSTNLAAVTVRGLAGLKTTVTGDAVVSANIINWPEQRTGSIYIKVTQAAQQATLTSIATYTGPDAPFNNGVTGQFTLNDVSVPYPAGTTAGSLVDILNSLTDKTGVRAEFSSGKIILTSIAYGNNARIYLSNAPAISSSYYYGRDVRADLTIDGTQPMSSSYWYSGKAFILKDNLGNTIELTKEAATTVGDKGAQISAVVDVKSVEWTNPLTGKNGTCAGTSTWSIPNLAVGYGQNRVTVTAYDSEGVSNSNTVTIVGQVAPAARYYVAPGNVAIRPGAVQPFRLYRTNENGVQVEVNVPVTWEADPAAGTVTDKGVFTAGDKPGFYGKAVKAKLADGTVAIGVVQVLEDIKQGGYLLEKSWGSAAVGLFKGVTGVAEDGNGRVYIVDSGNNRVQVFDTLENYLDQWGYYGSGDEQFNSPHGIAIDKSGNIYVCDTGNNRIKKFDSSGQFLKAWGSKGSGDGQFNYACALAVDHDGYVYVLDSTNNNVQKFDSSGNHITRWGSQGSLAGQFNLPTGITADSVGFIYVSDSSNHRVQKFDANGQFVLQWGSQGSGDGQFNSVDGIGFGEDGLIYVSDYSGKRVQMFNTSGSLVGKLANTYARTIGTGRGVIYTSCSSNLINKYDLSGNLLVEWYSRSGGFGTINNPSGVAAAPDGHLYIKDGSCTQGFDASGASFLYLATAYNDWIVGLDGNSYIDYYNEVFKQDVLGNKLASWTPDYYNGIYSIAVSPDGYVYALQQNKVTKLDSSLQKMGEWNVYADYDTKIAADASGNFYLVNYYQQPTIDKYDATGTKVDSLFSYVGNFYSTSPYPQNIDIDAAGNMYIIGANRITVLDPAGKPKSVCSFLNHTPDNLSVAADGSIYYASSSGGCVDKIVPVEPVEPPAISITGPTTNSAYLTTSYSIIIEGNASGDLSATYCTNSNGSGGAVAPSESWSMPIWLNPGHNVLTFIARDMAGREATATIDVICLYSCDLAIAPYGANLGLGVQQQFQARGYSRYQPDIQSFDIDNSLLTWSTDKRAGTITSSGLFTSGVTPGNYQLAVTVKVPGTTLYANVAVTIAASSGGYQCVSAIDFTKFTVGLSAPRAIAVDSAKNIYLLDNYQCCVYKISPSGALLSKWGSKGFGQGQLNGPLGIAVDASDNVYVADTANNRIQKFDSSGNYLAQWGSKGNGSGLFGSINSVAIDDLGNVYVVDIGNKLIQKFDSSGSFLTQWGSYGTAPGQFSSPWGIVVDALGYVYVLDRGCMIHKYDSSGNFVSRWGSRGSADGQMGSPYGIAADRFGSIFVADTGMQCIHKYNSSGIFISKCSSPFNGSGQLFTPFSVAVDSAAYVYALDNSLKKIYKFEPFLAPNNAKSLVDGSPAVLSDMVVTAGTSETGRSFYVESPDRLGGIRVTGASMQKGSTAFIRGTMATVNGERELQADIVLSTGTGSVAPIAMNNAAVGGGKCGLQEAVWGWCYALDSDGHKKLNWMPVSGINNIGLLIRTWGTIKSMDSNHNWFTIDDGSNLNIKCIVPSMVSFGKVGDRVAVTGISSCEKVGNQLLRVIRVREQSDITPY